MSFAPDFSPAGFDRTPPFSLEAETSVLGAILMDPGRPSPGPGPVAAFAPYLVPAAEEGSGFIVRPSIGAPSDVSETIFQRPLLIADRDGRATIRFDLPETPGTFFVTVDAHGDGRIGVGQAIIISLERRVEKP